MGAAQLGFSGGEPLVRQDLVELIAAARGLGYYTNLITSGIGLTEEKIASFADAGLDVRIHTPSDPSAPTKQVAAGRADLAISYEPEVVLAHDEERGGHAGAKREER